MTFTVEIKNLHTPDQIEVEIYVDRGALEDLHKQLSFLKDSGDHAHFFTASWGGAPLTEDKQVKSNLLSHHLRITLV